MEKCSRLSARAALSLALAAALCACGDGNRPEASQVAARVNGQDITVHQINYLLSRTPNVNPKNAHRAKRAILARLIADELARQQAVKTKLDRSPAVVQALEFAQTSVLARAYLDRIAATLPRPSAEEVKKYYADHPELFAQRRIYSLDDVMFTAKPEQEDAARAEAAKAKSMRELTSWLDSKGIAYARNRGVRAAEQVPLDLLPRLQAGKDGGVSLTSKAGGRFDAIQIIASRLAPVDEATAAPRIREFLFNRRASKAIEAEIKRLKEKADIAYLGEFKGSAAPEAEQKPGAGDQPTGPSNQAGVRGLFK